MLRQERLLIVHRRAGDIAYRTLAHRLATACEESSREATLCTATDLKDMGTDQLGDATVALVDPLGCSQEADDSRELFSRLSAARKRLAVLAEAAETDRFGRQFRLPIRYDALIDVGFVSQKEKLAGSDVPYLFLSDGPTSREKQTITQRKPSQRPIPWAVVGQNTEEQVRLAAELMEKLDPAGFVYLPNVGQEARRRYDQVGLSGLAAVLSETEYYVWGPDHDTAHYESFRFLEAVLAGAMPCKINRGVARKQSGVPGVFPSIKAFVASARREGFAPIQDSAREYYLSRGGLAGHLEEVLEHV